MRGQRLSRTWCVVILGAVCLGLPIGAGADAVIQHMKDATVRVFCVSPDGSGTGSGFVVGDGRYVVTNWHVAECTAHGGQTLVLLHAGRMERIEAEVRARDPDKDLAVIRLERPCGRPSVRFATVDTLEPRDQVTAVGFPGAADEIGGTAALTEPTFTAGVVSRVLPPPEDSADARLVQISAAINPGNSGGPLFDEEGRVIGVNSMGLRTSVQTQSGDVREVPVGEGFGWSIVADEVLPLLDALGISYEVSHSRPHAPGSDDQGRAPQPQPQPQLQPSQPQDPGPLWHREPLLTGVLVMLGLMTLVTLMLAVTQRGRAVVKDGVSRMFIPSRAQHGSVPAPPPVPRSHHPVLRGLTGPYAGVEVPLDGGKPVAIGRDPAMVQLVLPKGQPKVSKRHATIRFDAASDGFELEDCWSSCGTFVGTPGQKLTGGQSRRLSAGERFYLGSPDVGFEVGFD